MCASRHGQAFPITEIAAECDFQRAGSTLRAHQIVGTLGHAPEGLHTKGNAVGAARISGPDLAAGRLPVVLSPLFFPFRLGWRANPGPWEGSEGEEDGIQYGFLIDHRRCIGCHACTVACKAENDVPVGSFRTWVQYAEKGRFPAVRRHFAVLRCNHCTTAPCVTICPVHALEKRSDGIVDLDREACIGCRACMQACPYDALYLNDATGAVEKCHFCAHRVEKGLEPACVVICPEKAIISGDLHDPASPVSRMVAALDTEVRRPEQKTGPNVHYVGHEPSMLRPGSAARPPTFLWSERPPQKSEPWPAELPVQPETRTVLDAGHKVEWGGAVGLYMVTKSVAAGVPMLAPFAAFLGGQGFGAGCRPEIIALVFTLATCGLLAHDLARPWLFFRLLTRANWRSWLVKGTAVLALFSALLLASVAFCLAGLHAPAHALRPLSALVALAVAGYTAFLFGQCEGRDLWQSRLLLPHLLVQAVLCGAAVDLVLAPTSCSLRILLVTAGLAHMALALAERYRRHATENARQAAAFLGELGSGASRLFRDGLLVGVVLAALFTVLAPRLAWGPVLMGLVLYDAAYVRAGQLPPLS
ncbi:MAG: 4Fe-4S dicluster domain-containing protein [Acidobacteriota bacterium]